ncbi:MAG: small basic family protein [Armatimonadetes bacterium]|nr:small basic family protein [Armatimonadota bacterium]
MFVVFAGLLLGVLAGLTIPAKVPIVYAKYMSVAFLAALDSVMGAGRSVLEGKFHIPIFVSGFATNTLLAAFLTYVGDRLGVDLYMAAIITFGVRLFQDLTIIRRLLFERAARPEPGSTT